ncbi:MAG: 3-isopropylmalate dehydratase [Candidatus Thermoplasmatota archaeon]|nr:3-isopropylmalate dehydratase [Candidatus Thermoplasmatota archaeon]
MNPTTLTGRVWMLRDGQGELIDNIDTDMIFHNQYLHITDVDMMGQYALDNLTGWEDFAEHAEEGDIVIAGENFGSGSSRQQAVDCFISLGIQAIVAKSFGAIYKRNAINSGLPVLTGDMPGEMESGDVVTLNLESGVVTMDNEPIAKLEPMSQVQLDIYHAGDLFAYGRTLEE